MMNVKFIRGTFHLNLAYRAGDTAKLNDELAKKLIEAKYAVLNEPRKRKEVKPEVKTTEITRSKKRPVKK